MMNDIRDFMVTEVPLCTPLTSIDNIKLLMEEKGVSEILVVDTLLEKHLLGTINSNDISTKSIDQSVEPSDLNAEQCMRAVPVTIRETATREECQRLMQLRGITSLTVVDDEGHVCGIIDERNLVAQ